MKAPVVALELVLVFALSLLFLTGLIGWLQNVHIVTTNGMYKSIDLEPWVSDPARARLDRSNYLYFPLYGRLCHLLDTIGILRGQVWKQLAYLNAFWASIGSVLVYAFARRLSGRVLVAAAATAFHLGTGFVLLLSVINEDIMPGYVLVLGSMLLAGLWFSRPTFCQVVIVGVVFTIGWLVEWRLIFPTLPALLMALVISEGGLVRRAVLICTLLVAVLATTGLVQLVWNNHNGSVGVFQLLYTGKGVGSGWGGLTTNKLWLLLSGVSSYFLMGEVPFSAEAARSVAGQLAIPVLLEFLILGACVVLLWPRRHDRGLWAIAAVFAGTFGAGEIFNVYAQPHDPQMQINVMVWLTIAWTLLLGSVFGSPRVLQSLVVFSFLPLVCNVLHLASYRGRDATALAALSTVEKLFAPEATVFVYWGFEPITTWQFALWSHDWDWDAVGPPPPAPSKEPRFKWIAINGRAIHHPNWTAERDAAVLKQDIDAAFDRGYRVVISDVWTWGMDEFADQLGTLSAAGRAAAIHTMLHESYEAGRSFNVPGAGTYFELQRR